MTIGEQDISSSGAWLVETKFNTIIPPYEPVRDEDKLFSMSNVPGDSEQRGRSAVMGLFALAHAHYLSEVDKRLRDEFGYSMRREMDDGEYTLVVSRFNLIFNKPDGSSNPQVITRFSRVDGKNDRLLSYQELGNGEVVCITEFACVSMDKNNPKIVRPKDLSPEVDKMLSILYGNEVYSYDNIGKASHGHSIVSKFNGREVSFAVDADDIKGLVNTTVINKGLDHVGYSRFFELFNMGFLSYINEINTFMEVNYGYSFSSYLKGHGYSLMLLESNVDCFGQVFGNDKVSISTTLATFNSSDDGLGQEFSPTDQLFLTVLQKIQVPEMSRRGNYQDRVKIRSKSTLCIVDANTHRPVRIPKDIVGILRKFNSPSR